MDEDKVINIDNEITEIPVENITTQANVPTNLQDEYVQLPRPDEITIQDTNLVEIDMEETYPTVSLQDLSLYNNTNILIDGGSVNSSYDDKVSLLEILEQCAASGNGSSISDDEFAALSEKIKIHTDKLNKLESVQRKYSSENGLGEFRKWNDENPAWEDRSGYFVKIAVGTENVALCTNDDDVYGVCVKSSGFVGNQDATDKSDDPIYALVGISGALRVRTDGTASVGDYVVPNELSIATKSDNNCGYKVVSKGSYATYEYVTIAVTPQNDKINKIYGTLMSTEGSVGNLILRIEEAESKVDDMSGKINIAISDKEELRRLIDENTKNITSASNAAKDAQEAAKRATESANEAVSAAISAKDEALVAANEAKEQVNASLADINSLKENMEILSSFNDGQGNTGVQGFVNTAEENSMMLGTIQESVNKQGTDITSITQQVKETEAAIQHLVVHSDKYSVGENSLSYGLTYDEARSLLKDGDMYVSTSNHTETMERTTTNPDNPDESLTTTIEFVFERGYTYQWSTTSMTWVKGESVSTATTYAEGANVGDLWFCWQEVEYTDANGDVRTLLPGTLYRWSEDGQWVAIATTVNNYKSRMISSLKQTADGIRSDVVGLRGDISSINQEVDQISTTVATNTGNVSTLQQKVGSIETTVSNINGTMTDIKQQVDDNSAQITSVASGRFSVVYQSMAGSPALVKGQHKYTVPPSWDETQGKFIFNDALQDDTNGIYCYATQTVNGVTTIDETKYCKITSDSEGDKYDIYIVGNQITSMFENYIDDDGAVARMVAKMVDEKTESMNESIALVETKADTNSATINQVANYYYHKLLSVSETEVPVPSGELRYNNPPKWDATLGKYVFDANDVSENGAYYLADSEGSTYCCVKTAGNGSSVYEIYGLLANYIASITTGADEEGGYIQSIVMDIERYNVSQYSPSYGMSYDDAVSTIPQGTMYVPTEAHSENLMPDERIGTDEINVESLSAGTLEERESDNQLVRLSAPTFEALETTTMQTYDFEVHDGTTYRYEWTGKEWAKGPSVAYGSEYNYDGSTDLWYCTQDVTVPGESGGASISYQAGTLYKRQGDNWYAIATVNDSLLLRSLSLVRQTADSYSIELRNVQGDFSQYKQTVDEIGLTVHGSDGSDGSWTVTSTGLYGQVFSRTGNSGTLRTEVDAIKATMELMITGVYPQLEQPLTDNVPAPYGTWGKYSVRPEWSKSLKKFVFDTNNEDENGIYYFFDDNEQHYCKVVGTQYEVYKIGTLATAGVDSNITEESASLSALTSLGDDEVSTFAGLRNLALKDRAQVQLLTSLDTNKLNRVVDMYGYTVPEGTKRYADKPTYLNGAFTFSGQVENDDGEYFLINSQQFGKLILGTQGSCYGYEVYDYDGNNTAGLVSTVLDNQAKVGMIVDANGVQGGVVVEAINDQSQVKIYGDKLDIKGITTVSNSSGSQTVIDGNCITTGNIGSANYNYSSGYFSTAGTQFNLTNGAITSENFAIDANGNLYLKGDISATNARIKGGLSVGSSDGTTYNFTVDANGNVSVSGTLDAQVLKIKGENVLTSSNKISADYLELRGITIRDNSGNVTFKVDSSGYVTISGTMTGSMSWGNITGVPSTVTGAYDLADSAYDRADSAYARATTAINDASDVADTVSGWTYRGTTYIDGAKIETGTVMASSLIGGQVVLLTEDESEAGIIKISDASTAEYAVDLKSNSALRVEAADGSLYLSSNDRNFINLADTKYISVGDSAARLNAGFVPADDCNYLLGAPNYKWKDIYEDTSTTTTSDKRKKKDISYDLQKYESFFCSLKPTQYKFINNTSDRYHIGFISQDIENALVNNGLKSSDFAGFIKSPIYIDESETTIEDYYYGLRYDEFIALNTHMIQKLYTKIDALENKIQQLENTSTEME